MLGQYFASPFLPVILSPLTIHIPSVFTPKTLGTKQSPLQIVVWSGDFGYIYENSSPLLKRGCQSLRAFVFQIQAVRRVFAGHKALCGVKSLHQRFILKQRTGYAL